MKKTLTILSLVAGIGFSAFALFKLLTSKDDGKENTQNDPAEAGNTAKEESQEGSQEAGA